MPYGNGFNGNMAVGYPYNGSVYNYNPLQQKVEVIRVHGEDGAKAYPLPPNSSVLLLDETAPIVWLKMTDGGSYPTLTGYNITPVVSAQQEQKESFESLEARISKLERTINGKSYSQPNKRQQNGNSENEQHGA